MRRLPVYLVLDVSGSMHGEPIESVRWVSASISTSSKKIDLTKKDAGSIDQLPPPPPEIKLV